MIGYCGIWVLRACDTFIRPFFGGGRLLWILMMFEQNLLSFSSLCLVYGSYEHVTHSYDRFLAVVGYYGYWWCLNRIYCHFHHCAWYMGLTSMWHIHTTFLVLYCIVSYSSALYRIVLHCILWYLMVVLCLYHKICVGILWYCIAFYGIGWYYIVLYDIAWYCMV